MKPLDIVRIKRTGQHYYNEEARQNMGLVTEENGGSVSVRWFIPGTGLCTAWWGEKDLEVVANLAAILSDEMAHPFGSNREQGEKFYGEKK